MYIGGLLDRLRSPKHAGCPLSRYSGSGAQKKAEHNASCKHRRGLLGTPIRWRCPSKDTGILDRDGLGLDCIDLLEFLQEAIVQATEGICRTFEFSHRDLSLTARRRLPDRLGHGGNEFILSCLGYMILVSVGLGNSQFLVSD